MPKVREFGGNVQRVPNQADSVSFFHRLLCCVDMCDPHRTACGDDLSYSPSQETFTSKAPRWSSIQEETSFP